MIGSIVRIMICSILFLVKLCVFIVLALDIIRVLHHRYKKLVFKYLYPYDSNGLFGCWFLVLNGDNGNDL